MAGLSLQFRRHLGTKVRIFTMETVTNFSYDEHYCQTTRPNFLQYLSSVHSFYMQQCWDLAFSRMGDNEIYSYLPSVWADVTLMHFAHITYHFHLKERDLSGTEWIKCILFKSDHQESIVLVCPPLWYFIRQGEYSQSAFWFLLPLTSFRKIMLPFSWFGFPPKQDNREYCQNSLNLEMFYRRIESLLAKWTMLKLDWTIQTMIKIASR